MNRTLLIIINVALLAVILTTIPLILNGDKPYKQNTLGVKALEAGQYDQAINHLTQAHNAQPDNKDFQYNLLAAYSNKALHQSNTSNTQAAINTFEQALKLAPKNQAILRNYISTLNNLGVQQSDAHQFTTAQTYFEKASKALPDLQDTNVQNNIRENYSALLTLWATELMKRNQVTEAMTALTQAIKLNPKNNVALVSLGDLAYEVNDYATATKNYAKALPLNSQNKEYLQNRLQMIKDESQLEANFQHITDKNKHFLLQYVPYKGGTTIQQVLTMLTDAYDTIGKDLGVYPARAVNVKVYTPKDFFKVAKLPEWAIGIFDGKMRLRADELQSAPELVKDLIFHEYTHAVLAMNIKQEVPAWFHEGIAQLMEPQFRENSREQEQIRLALARHEISFEQLNDSFKEITDKGDAENAYLLSKYFLTHLNRKYGHEKLRNWIKRLTKGENFTQAFQHEYQTPLNQAQKNWIKTQTKN